MSPQNVREQNLNNTGFSLIEMLITVIIVGVLMSISVPSLVGMMDQNRVKDGLRQIEGGFKEAQKQAARIGKSCRLVLNISAKTFTADPNECLSGEKYLNASQYNGISLKTDNTDTTQVDITYSFKGTRLAGDPQRTIVIFNSTNGLKKCIIITPGLGTIKTGNYQGGVAAGDAIVANSCQVNS
jgi:prepilin-type N-terminal cleavage/methylation domain-containing protein